MLQVIPTRQHARNVSRFEKAYFRAKKWHFYKLYIYGNNFASRIDTDILTSGMESARDLQSGMTHPIP